MCIVKVEDELSVCLKIKTPSFIPKKKLKLCICVWTSMTWLRALESTLPFKIASCISWETTLNCFVAIPLWQSNNLGLILCHQSFLLHCLSLTCWKLISFLESIFSYSFGNKAFHYFSQFKCCVKRGSNYFYGRVYSATKFFHGIVIAGVILPRDEI